MSNSNQNDYKFAAHPQVVKNKPRYRQGSKKHQYQNLMFERRVVRGNTYSPYMVAQNEVEEAAPRARAKFQPKRQDQEVPEAYNANEVDQEIRSGELQPPPGVDYRYNGACTDDGVTTETDLPPCHEATTQTEYIIPKIIPDLSMPVYTGKDKETQIYQEGEDSIFDFDYEAEPIARAIATKVLEESQIEVVEEEELDVMKKRQEFLLQKAKETSGNLQNLEQREQKKAAENLSLIQQRRKQKDLMIDVHQHLVSRVYAKRYLSDTLRASFEILETMGAYLDEGEKEVKVNFLPWLFDETMTSLQSAAIKNRMVVSLESSVQAELIKVHKLTVNTERERRRVEEEERQRLQREREERRRLKLEYKLKKMEDARLFNLEKLLMETFVDTGDRDNEIVNISEIDGTDANGSKSIGMKGGLLGELYSFIKEISNDERFKLTSNEKIGDVIEKLFSQFVGLGWTVMIGLRQEFSTNFKALFDDYEPGDLTLEYLRDLDVSEREQAIEYILRHYVSTYFESINSSLAVIQEKHIVAMRPVIIPETPEVEEGEPKEEDEEDGSQEKTEENNVENPKNQEEEIPPEDKAEEEPVPEVEEVHEPTEEEIEAENYLSFIKTAFVRLFSPNCGINL